MVQQKLNRSFSRRIGKSLSNLQNNAITNLLPKYILNPDLLNIENSSYIAEIGIGMGEHFIEQASLNKDKIFIGFEPYLNGIANSLLMAQKREIQNILLWPDDMDLIFNKLPDNLLDAIYILFPDPWPKNKQKKKRIFCADRLELFITKLKPQGKIYFASDIEDYINHSVKTILSNPLIKIIQQPSIEPHEGYLQTKYHSKALNEGRLAQFIIAEKL